MSDIDRSTARSEEPALDSPESGSARPVNFEARSPNDAPPASPPRAQAKPLAIDLEFYGRWTGEEHGEVW